MASDSQPSPNVRDASNLLRSLDFVDVAPGREDFSLFLIVTAGYFLTGILGRHTAIPNANIAALWLPAGVSLAAVMLKGNKALPGVFAGSLLVNLFYMRPFAISAAVACFSVLEAFVGGCFVAKYANGVNAFAKLASFCRFVLLAGILTPALLAALGVSILIAGGLAPAAEFSSTWTVWWVGDMLGVLLTVPFLVLLLGHIHNSLALSETLELATLLVGLSLVSVLNFGPPISSVLPKSGFQYLCAPFLAWACIRFCALEAAGATLIVGGIAMWGTSHGLGPFGDSGLRPLFRIGFVFVSSVTTMGLAIEWSRQRRELAGVRCAYLRLKETVASNRQIA